MIYHGITSLRNFFFDKEILRAVRFDVETIGVGNLSVGGTGKTPLVEYLVQLLKDSHNVATLSRGYRRKTKGFILADHNATAAEIGDEPCQFLYKYGDKVTVAVGEDRVLAIPQILYQKPDVDLILLDDIFQHRYVSPSLLILLTTFDRPFYQDHLIPSGLLRESRKGAKRADAIVVTKCPVSIDSKDMIRIRTEISQFNPSVPVFFSSIAYGPLRNYEGDLLKCKEGIKVVLMSGLANAQHFEDYLASKYEVLKHFKFKDHHHYTEEDLLSVYKIVEQHEDMVLIISTEKDMVKLKQFDWSGYNLAYLPIEVVFQENENDFKEFILSRL